jgi:hypothetical protein
VDTAEDVHVPITAIPLNNNTSPAEILPTTTSNVSAVGIQVNTAIRNLTPHQQILLERMNDIQSKPTEHRIRELFMEIDQLGNYTQETWFSNLSERTLVHFYRYLYDIWRHRGNLSEEVRTRICSLQDPFRNIETHITNINIDVLRKVCLNVMEHMVYTGIDVEYQKLGALHVLSAMTLVSIPARNAMYWLYEGLS